MPLILAHFPGAGYVIPPFAILFLALGAVLPPVILLRRQPSKTWLRNALRILAALMLNFVGFSEFMGMSWMLGAAVFSQADEIVFMFAMGCLFFTVEGLAFLWRSYALTHPRA